MKQCKRFVAVLLVLVALFGCFASAVPAFAAETDEPTVSTEAETESSTETTTAAETEAAETVATTETAVTETTSATEASESTTAAPAPAETATTETTAPAETELATVSVLTGTANSRGAEVTVTLPEGMTVPEGTALALADVDDDDLDWDIIDAACTDTGIDNFLDYMPISLGVPGISADGAEVSITFASPNVKALDSSSVWVLALNPNGTYARYSVKSTVDTSNNITWASFTAETLAEGTVFILGSTDAPSVLGLATYSQYTVSASNGVISGIGDSNGALTYHCFSASGTPSASRPAICLDSGRLYGGYSGDYWSIVQTNGWLSNDARYPDTKSWAGLDLAKRQKITLLLVYGLSDWSPSSRYIDDINNGNTFAAMQLVAWEILDGVSAGTYTSHYNSTVQSIASNLYTLINTNPDNVSTTETTLYIIYPTNQVWYVDRYVWGQSLVALHEPAYTNATGDVTITKAITGSGSKANWKFELYTSSTAASSGTGYIASAYTNSSGVATFSDLDAGTTYYIKEAPASRQDKVTTTNWSISTTVKSVTVVSGVTTSAGTITNTSPGSLSVTKAVSGSGSVEGWVFNLYSSSANAAANTNIVATATTNSSGVATFSNLKAGTTYYIKEAPASSQTVTTTNWTLSTTVLSGKVVAGSTTSVGTATNSSPGGISVQKEITTAAGTTDKLDGWVFQIATDSAFTSIVQTLTTDSTGAASTGLVLPIGTYYVREAPYDLQTRADKDNYVLSSTVTTVTVTAGNTVAAIYTGTATAINIEKGKIQVAKGLAGNNFPTDALSGWIFNVTTADGTLVTTITTGDDGYGTSGYLAPGTYYVQEADYADQTRADIEKWTIDDTKTSVTVTAGATVDAFATGGYTSTNIYGKLIHIQKVSTCSAAMMAQLDGNAMYSLEGAQYNIVVDGVVVETLTTDAEGKATSTTIFQPGDTGTLVETVAPEGYLLNDTPTTFTIPDGIVTYTVEVEDDPTFDPAWFTFTKVDAATGVAMGNTSFEGAVFRWDYYDNTTYSGTPVRSWYFVTDADGTYKYDEQYLDDSGSYTSDELYYNDNSGLYELPLGSVVITEISAPTGYVVMQPLYATITQETNGSETTWSWSTESWAFITEVSGGITASEAQDTTTFGSVTIKKLDKDLGTTLPAGVTLEGCEFSVINRSANAVKVADYDVAQPGEVCYKLYIGADYTVTSGDIFPIGSYEIVETNGNDYYIPDADFTFTFSVTTAEKTFETSCENILANGLIHVLKVDTEGTALPGAKFVLEWSEDGTTWAPVTYSAVYQKGGCSSADLAADGSLTTDADGYVHFEGLSPLLSYRITEVATPSGYTLLTESIEVEELNFDNDYEVTYKVVDGHSFVLPKTGSAGNWMYGTFGVAAMAAAAAAVYFVLRKKDEEAIV